MGEASLALRFRPHLQTLLEGTGTRAPRLLVAFSGGLDSMVLLHLLRFQIPSAAIRLTAAHFDHRMRPESSRDAAWAGGVCEAWGVPFRSEVSRSQLRNEQEARLARYDFLWKAFEEADADLLLTAHHADDQAETVLFRILRGSGISGLRGIPEKTRSGLLRPLLPFWRDELARYASEANLRWRNDPTNEDHGPARNRIRNRLFPDIEEYVAPGARRSLVRLADLARENERGWHAVVAGVEQESIRIHEGVVLVARDKLRAYHPAIGSRVLRNALRRFGTIPRRIGTRSALKFITNAPSGRELQLAGGLRIRTEFDVARIERTAGGPEEDRPIRIDAAPEGPSQQYDLQLGGRSYRVLLRTDGGSDARGEGQSAGWEVVLPADALRFPLCLRARRAGDRIETTGGTKSLKKLMIERRVPVSERNSRPVLEDATGRVLWVAGVGAARSAATESSETTLHLAIENDPGR